MPDSDLLDAKLESLNRCLGRIRSRMPESATELTRDHDAQDIVSVNLQRAVQICVDLSSHLISIRGWEAPETMAESFAVLARNGAVADSTADQMRKAVAFRNITVHEYQTVDWNLVFELATGNLDLFHQFARAIVTAWRDAEEIVGDDENSG